MRKASWILVLLVFTGGCGDDAAPSGAGPEAGMAPVRIVAPTEKPAVWPSADERRTAPGRYPAPYTAAQIRAGCADGRTAKFRMDLRGQEMLQRWRFSEGNAEGVTWTTQTLGPDGAPTGEPRSQRFTWVRLQEHASYPAAETQVTQETIEVPAGPFACMCYTTTQTEEVVGKVDGRDVRTPRVTVMKRWFAWALPGPPVKTEERLEGEIVSSMELVEHGFDASR